MKIFEVGIINYLKVLARSNPREFSYPLKG